MSADDQVIDVPTAVETSDLLDELSDLRVDDSDDDEPVLVRADGRPVDTWRERHPYPERMRREDYERTKRLLVQDGIHLIKLWSRCRRPSSGPGSSSGRSTRSGSGSCRPPTSPRWRGGTTTPGPRRPSSSTPTPTRPRGWWSRATTKGVGGSRPMRYVLDRFDHDDKDQDTVGTPDPRIVGSPDEVYDEDRLADQPQAGS